MFLSVFQRASLVAQMVKKWPAMWETWVQSLGWEVDLEKGMAAHSSILACRIPWTEEPGGLQSMGLQRVKHDWVIFTFTFLSLSKIQKNDYLFHTSTGTSLMKLTSSISLANFKIHFQFCSHLDFVSPFILFSNPCKGILKYF